MFVCMILVILTTYRLLIKYKATSRKAGSFGLGGRGASHGATRVAKRSFSHKLAVAWLGVTCYLAMHIVCMFLLGDV